jgi:hypothetical protein
VYEILTVLLPNMALEIVAPLEETIDFRAIYWALVKPGGIMDIVDVASNVLGIFERLSIAPRDAVIAGDMRSKMC